MAKNKFSYLKISEFLKVDPDQKMLFWKQSRVRYRVALWLIPRNEMQALCAYFGESVDQIERKFKLV